MNRTLVSAVLVALAAGACSRQEPTGATEPAAAVREERETQPTHAVIGAQAADRAGIRTEVAGPASIRQTLELYGMVQANAEQVRTVSGRFPGVVKSVQGAVGDSVRTGSPLASIESNDSLQTYVVTAPMSGTVTARNVNPGESVTDQALFVITDLGSVWVELTLFPRDLPRVQRGQSVRIVSIDDAMEASGPIAWIAAVGNPANQGVTARVVLDNPDRRWTPGFFVTGEVVLDASEVPLAVASTALQTMGGKAVVFVATDDGFEARTVAAGRADRDHTEILHGLRPGERYAAANSFVIKAEIEKGSAEDED